nr:hypothetical protein [Campylobacter lari]MCR6529215.1 hypothetical protein [Campylobacter lari]
MSKAKVVLGKFNFPCKQQATDGIKKSGVWVTTIIASIDSLFTFVSCSKISIDF